MNAYFVSAGEVTTYDIIDRESDLKVPETGYLVELVAASTRSKATYLVWKKHEWDLGALNEQRWQTRLIASEVDRPTGILSWNDPLWRSEVLPEPQDLRAPLVA